MKCDNFESFAGDVDLDRPFGLRIRLESESAQLESGIVCLRPRVEGPPLHLHRHQDEEFQVLQGRLAVMRSGQLLSLEEGDRVQIPRGIAHTYANRSDQLCLFRYRLTPGGSFTRMMRCFEELSRAGKLTSPRHLWTLLRIAAVMVRFEEDLSSVRPPQGVMRVLAFLGRCLG